MSNWARLRISVILVFGIIFAFVGPRWYYYPEERPWYRDPSDYPYREPTFKEAVAALYDPESAPIEAFTLGFASQEAVDWLKEQGTPQSGAALIQYTREFPAKARYNRIYDYLIQYHRTPEALAAIRAGDDYLDELPLMDIFTLEDELVKRRNLVDTTRDPQIGVVVRAISSSWAICLAERPSQDDAWRLTYVAKMTDGPMLDSYSHNKGRNWTFDLSHSELGISITEGDRVAFDLTGIHVDTDRDGLSDRFEQDLLRTDPRNADSDSDGIADRLDDNPLTPLQTQRSERNLVLRAAARYVRPGDYPGIKTFYLRHETEPMEFPGMGAYVLPQPTQEEERLRQVRESELPKPRPRKLISYHSDGSPSGWTAFEIAEISETTARVRAPQTYSDGALILNKIDDHWYITGRDSDNY